MVIYFIAIEAMSSIELPSPSLSRIREAISSIGLPDDCGAACA